MAMPSASVANGERANVSMPATLLGEEPDQGSRVLIIEDHPLYVDALTQVLEARGAYKVVGVAASSSMALSMARQFEPQIVLLDLELPGASGLDLISPLSRICPQSKIVILTGHGEDGVALAAVRLGAQGYLQKDLNSAQILSALELIAHGERVIGKPQTLTAVLNECSFLMRNRDREKLGISDQEVEIIKLAAAGKNNKDIGLHQFWSEVTVKRKMQDIYRKLGVKTRAQAVAEAIRLGYI